MIASKEVPARLPIPTTFMYTVNDFQQMPGRRMSLDATSGRSNAELLMLSVTE
eukprot:gene3199-5927_t